MAYIIIAAVALVASGLTFFTGFGLGTLLLPAFVVFFPVHVAVALTAVVHLLNNLFKLALVGRHADWRVVFGFGAPAVVAAFAGAVALLRLADLPPLLNYHAAGRTLTVMPVKLVVAALMLLFAAPEVWPRFGPFALDRKYLPLGGVLSGFFGGLSGHQGAFRSAFLLRAGLGKEAFIATGVVIAVLVDLSRLAVYGSRLAVVDLSGQGAILTVATAAAFSGAFAGSRLLRKIALRAIEVFAGCLLAAIALALAFGLL